jgi:cytochrome P450
MQPAPSLPPGHREPVVRSRLYGRHHLIEKFTDLGPVFAINYRSDLSVYIVGLDIGHRFLMEHSKNLNVVSMELKSLFDEGCIRKMTGKIHQVYRGSLIKAINAINLDEYQEDLAEIAASSLATYQSGDFDANNAVNGFIRSLDDIASSMLLQVFFGAGTRARMHRQLLEYYRDLGPDGLAWFPGEEEHQAYYHIRDYLKQHIDSGTFRKSAASTGSIFGEIFKESDVDDSMLGNLIYMVEMGRFDLYSLFRWITRYACDYPDTVTAIAHQAFDGNVKTTPLASAFVKETLRMDQSEKLLREAKRDIIFDGYLIPKDSKLQICLWESHKLTQNFEQPFEFKPERFLENDFSPSQYSPFGLDQHRCPFANMVFTLGDIYLTTLAKHYFIEGIDSGPPTRGLFHWQPASRFTVRLHSRNR